MYLDKGQEDDAGTLFTLSIGYLLYDFEVKFR
jgi:hypothetical protein